MKQHYKLVYNGGRNGFINRNVVSDGIDFTPSSIGPRNFTKIYLICVKCKPNQFSLGEAKKQLLELANQRFALKEVDYKITTRKTKKNVYVFCEFWQTQQLEYAKREEELNEQRSNFRDLIRKMRYSPNPLYLAEMRRLLGLYKELDDEFRNCLVALSDGGYEYNSASSIMRITILKSKLSEVAKFATAKGISIKVDDIPDIQKYNSYNWALIAPEHSKVVVVFKAPPEMLVYLRMRMPVWQQE